MPGLLFFLLLSAVFCCWLLQHGAVLVGCTDKIAVGHNAVFETHIDVMPHGCPMQSRCTGSAACWCFRLSLHVALMLLNLLLLLLLLLLA